MQQIGLTGVGMAAASMVGTGLVGTAAAGTTKITDADIVNFALNLEYLEAESYSVATYGKTLVELGVISESDTTGPTTGGNAVPDFASSPVAYIASALRENEIAHVLYLQAALGSAAVKKPAINLDALGYGFSSVDSFLVLARRFEDVGVSAYLGAAPLIKNKTYLAAAAAILAAEAQHSGSIREACINMGVTSPAVDSLDVPPPQARRMTWTRTL